MSKRIVVQSPDGKTIQVFWLGKTSNAKIAKPNEKIVQTYTFSIDQFDFARSGQKIKMSDFFMLDSKNCFDCAFSGNSGNGRCYTHKPIQYSGFLSMLRAIKPEDIHNGFGHEVISKIMDICTNRYVRFGSYGEPSLHPIGLVWQMTSVAKSWTGYTHQWFRADPNYARFFMASVHSPIQAKTAKKNKGYRSFIATSKPVENSNAVKCPASKEGGRKTTCSKCGLCSGTLGKGYKDVEIIDHF